jgi:predicted nucleotidyltransferase
MDQAESPLRLDAILRTLVEFSVEFVVVGGVAVQAHGYLRGTGDLDIVPRPTLLNLSRLAEALADLGAKPRRATLPADVTDPQMLNRVPLAPLVTRHGRLDVLNLAHTSGAPGSFDELMERALAVDLDGLPVAIAGIDDLLRMKRSAGRPQDLTDIGALTRTDEELQREAREST